MTKLHTVYLKKKLSNLSKEKNLSIFDSSGLKSHQFHIISLYAYQNKSKIYFLPTHLLDLQWNQSKSNSFIVLAPVKGAENVRTSTSLISSQVRCLGVCIKNSWFFGEEAVIKEDKESLKKKIFLSLIKKLQLLENSS